MKIEKILVPTDFSGHSEEALKSALRLKNDFGAQLTVLHVFDVSEMLGLGWTVYGESLEAEVISRMETDARNALKEFVKKAGAKENEVATLVARGRPFVETVRLARNENVDLIVMGTHGRKGIEHLLMGSNAEKVVRKAHCSVLTIKRSENRKKPPFPASRILVPTDFSLTSERAMSMALKLAQKYHADILLLHIFADLKIQEAIQWTEYLPTAQTDLELEEGIKKRAEEEMTAFIAKFPVGDVKIITRILSDIPHKGIVETAVKENSDLIVMGTHGRSGLTYLLMGSTAEKVVRTSSCPVLTVKPSDHIFKMP